MYNNDSIEIKIKEEPRRGIQPTFDHGNNSQSFHVQSIKDHDEIIVAPFPIPPSQLNLSFPSSKISLPISLSQLSLIDTDVDDTLLNFLLPITQQSLQLPNVPVPESPSSIPKTPQFQYPRTPRAILASFIEQTRWIYQETSPSGDIDNKTNHQKKSNKLWTNMKTLHMFIEKIALIPDKQLDLKHSSSLNKFHNQLQKKLNWPIFFKWNEIIHELRVFKNRFGKYWNTHKLIQAASIVGFEKSEGQNRTIKWFLLVLSFSQTG